MLIENMNNYTPPDPDLNKKIRCPQCKQVGVVEWNRKFSILNGDGEHINIQWTDEGMKWLHRQSGFSMDPEWHCTRCDIVFRADQG